MTETIKILGQAAPGATTSTDLYTVPASTQVVLSSIVVCNRSSSPDTYRISIAADGATLANQQYIAYDAPILGNETITYTLGLTINSTDKVRVYAGTANLSFSVFGSELT